MALTSAKIAQFDLDHSYIEATKLVILGYVSVDPWLYARAPGESAALLYDWPNKIVHPRAAYAAFVALSCSSRMTGSDAAASARSGDSFDLQVLQYFEHQRLSALWDGQPLADDEVREARDIRVYRRMVAVLVAKEWKRLDQDASFADSVERVRSDLLKRQVHTLSDLRKLTSWVQEHGSDPLPTYPLYEALCQTGTIRVP